MKLIGLLRIRNESEIIVDTLNHMSEFCDGIYIYDDNSTDNTVELCRQHEKVRLVIEGENWDVNRERAEHENRQAVFLAARNNENLKPNDWFIYMDADERIDFDFSILCDDFDAVKLRLFDFYITDEDVNKHYSERKWIGPEFRDILFLFKNSNAVGYSIPDQRECFLTPRSKVIISGYVKHYGKSVSIQQWEDTCDYYANNFPKYAKKWEARKGKAIHTKSDFGRELILWDDRVISEKIIKIG